MFEQGVVSEGATLTVVGMGAALGLLLLMMLVIGAVGRVVGFAERRAGRGGALATTEQPASDRDKALAAVVAVSALQGRRADSRGTPPNDPHV